MAQRRAVKPNRDAGNPALEGFSSQRGFVIGGFFAVGLRPAVVGDRRDLEVPFLLTVRFPDAVDDVAGADDLAEVEPPAVAPAVVRAVCLTRCVDFLRCAASVVEVSTSAATRATSSGLIVFRIIRAILREVRYTI